ncbi:MAG TPA: hypothetical protein VF813_00645 [Anaerolineaceae bacterium]
MPIPRPRLSSVLLSILALVVLAGCGPSATARTPDRSAVATIVAATLSASALPTQAASVAAPSAPAVPTQETGSKAVLVSAAGANSELEAALKELAGKAGLAVETRAQLAPGDMTPGWKVVVMAAPPANLDQLLSAAPQTQFLVFSAADIPTKAKNLTLVVSHREQEAFLAGYVAELVTGDWRAAGLLASDTPLGGALQDAFLDGGRYYCGRCVPLNPPVAFFPLAASLPANSSPDQWKAAVDEMQKKILDVVYVSPEASSPDLLNYLAGQKVRILGGQPPSPEAQGNWIATLRIDTAASLRSLWPDLLAGKGGQAFSARIAVTDIQAQWLTPGRQRLVTEAIDNLEKGLINPLPAP